ncbi:MAG: carboxylesterase family protein [Deltaproteobacteria bacterium]|nr:carboxylesterase family protein [Deltaproteobacteria bacterium]
MLAALCMVLLAIAGCSTPAPAPKKEVDVGSRRSPPAGDVVGSVGASGAYEYLGLPYAEPPVGEGRWRAPKRTKRWSDAREATALGAACVQFPSRFGGLPGDPGEAQGDEDCLFLNVYTPRYAGPVPSGDQALPVMVWIHGGGNVIGQGGNYDGGYLAVAQDLVVVTINYRLGPLGWFRHASLRGEGTTPEDASGNFGTLDMILALDWVRDNIAAFGGDPGNVTIFGESAGGRDVLSLVQSPPARGRFHRAISQSGGMRRSTAEDAENFVDDPEPGHKASSSEILLRWLIADGRAADRESAKTALASMSPDEIAKYLRGKSAEEFLETYPHEATEGLIDVPQVFAEGTVLPIGDGLASFASADGHAKVPVMLGTNRDEQKLFLYPNPEHVRQVLWILPRLRDPDRYEALSEHSSALWKATGADEPAAALIRGGAPGVFVYRFDWDEEPTIFGADLGQMIGAAHGFEIPFVLGNFDLGEEANVVWTEENEPGRKLLSEQMMSYWANFAATGSPGRGRKGDLPEWKHAPSFLVFDTAAGGGVRMSQDTIGEEEALADAYDDARLGNDEERCAAYRDLVAQSTRHGRKGAEGPCAEVPRTS